MEQVIFSIVTLLAFGFFAFNIYKVALNFKFTRPLKRLDKIVKRFLIMLKIAFGQTKVFKKPIAGFFHALVFWGFLVISVGTLEMIIDGITGANRALSGLGILYDIITWSGEIFAVLLIIASIVFLCRRFFVNPKRFTGSEMTTSTHNDATFVLIMILLLMLSLLGTNIGYLQTTGHYVGSYPVSNLLKDMTYLLPEDMHAFESINWWIHISIIYVFLNVLPYSKHFHVILAVPNVFLTRLEPKAKLNTMASITKEVKIMMHPENLPDDDTAQPERFGIKDCDDVTWKDLMNALSCTQGGRCTAVCPANITGKILSPRKLYVDLRTRAKDKLPGLLKKGKEFSDGKSLVGDYISAEELWACTTCMACVEACPVEINHVPLIIDMRRNLVMEESKTSPELNSMFSNIENNGAPWPFSPEDRMNWAEGLEIETMAKMKAKGEDPEILFWVGCSGAFDDRYKTVTKAFASILKQAGIKFAVLGKEESCTGDPAKRAGHEFLYQMQAMKNIEILNNYNIKKIVTGCPHCFNTLKNEYPDLGGNYEVIHHSVLLQQLIEEGKIQIKESNEFNSKKITFHDSCYLGRGNDIYKAPRQVIESLNTEIREMSRCKERGVCCGAGGAQMFKEEEQGNKPVYIERTEEALNTGADIIASACPFCMTMLDDGLKDKGKEDKMKVLDLAELLLEANNTQVQ